MTKTSSSGGAVNGTFTFSVRGQFEDGTPINFHLTDHFKCHADRRRVLPYPLPRLTDTGRAFIQARP